MNVSVPKALISTMQGVQTKLVLNVCPVFQRHSLVTCKGFKQYQYSMFVSIPNVPILHHAKAFKQYQYSMYGSVPKALISNMHMFQPILVLNVCQCSNGTHQYHARVSNKIGTQCLAVFQKDSLVTCTGFQAILVLNICQCSNGTHSVTCKGFKQYQYSMYVSVPKALISNMLGFQTLLLLNVCQCSKGTHQYHARVSSNISTQYMSVFQRHSSSNMQSVLNNISTQCMSVFQRHSLVTMLGLQTLLLLNVCQCCKGTHQYHARGIKLYQYSMNVSVPKALISTMQVF